MSEQLMLWVGKVFARIDELKSREDGQALVEYGLILALVAVVCIAALQLLGTSVRDQINAIATAIAGA
jgi:pilus assembly protein Flp/PilA